MKINKLSTRLILLILACVFSVGLIFASLELPSLFDNFLGSIFNFPDYDQQASDFHISKTELYFDYYNLNVIGYIGLGLIVALIVIGFATNKIRVSLIGAFVMFLPVFGHFALTMFFLAGLGFFRVLWIPFTQISPIAMQLGDIILTPYLLLLDLGYWIGINLRLALPVFFIATGVILFIWGVYVWFITRYSGNKVAKSWIYKISRHPQYLGWIIWSYGLFLLPGPNLKKTWGYPDTLPWLLATMVIIAISMLEELRMKKKYGSDYESFRKNTSFMFPIPSWIKKFFKFPLWLFYKNWKINSKRKVFIISVYNTLILILASYIYLAFSNPSVDNFFMTKKRQRMMNEWVFRLENGETSRTKDVAAMELERYNDKSYDKLIQVVQSKNNDPVTKRYAIRTLGKIGDTSACQEIIKAVQNDTLFLDYEITGALCNLQCDCSKEILLKNLKETSHPFKGMIAITLGKMGVKETEDVILNQYNGQDMYCKTDFIVALGFLRSQKAVDLIIAELSNPEKRVREAAIVALSKIKNPKALEPLKKIENSDDWELAVYAKEAVKIIEKEHSSN